MDIVIRATVVFFLLLVVLRVMGKRQLGQMTPFEFVALVVLGDFVQQAVTHADTSISGAMLAVVTFCFWSLVLGWISYSSKRARHLLEGQPRVVIQGGTLDQEMLKRDRIAAEEVLGEMRLQGIAKLDDVAWGILETNGRISFIRKADA